MANTIYKVAVHDLKKTVSGFDVVLGKDDLATSPTAKRVIDDLHELYGRRTSKSHGRFSPNAADYPTEGHLKEYLDASAGDFSALTQKLMTTLQLQAQRRPGATGGHVFFAHFGRDARQYLLVAIVNDKLGAALTQDLEVRDVQHLDMDGFRFAGRINLTGWLAGDARYVGFLKGKGDVSEYFREFLGCDATTQERQDTADLVRALKDFAEAEGMAQEAKDDFLGRAKSICERSIKARSELELEALSNELLPSNPRSLLDVLTDPDRGLNDNFIPHRGALGSLVRYRAKTPLWSLDFSREALSQGAIRFDPKAKTLTIRNLPPEFSAQLDAELGPDAAN